MTTTTTIANNDLLLDTIHIMLEEHDGDFTIILDNGKRVLAFDHLGGLEYAAIAVEIAADLGMVAALVSHTEIMFTNAHNTIRVLLK